MASEKVFFTNDHGSTLAGILDGEGDTGVILASHFMGFKEVKHLYKIAMGLADAGMCALRFDFSDCIGESESQNGCEDMRVSHQARDVIAAMNFMEERGVKKIGLMGHSLGGTTVIVAAANDARVKAIVVAAALARLEWDKLFKEKAEQWKKQGFITFPSWKKGEIKIKYGFYKDLAQYDAAEMIKKVNAPVLVIQPGVDELVSMQNAQGIYDAANTPKELKVVEGADHMFSNKEHEQKMVDLTVEWFKKWLS